MVAIKKDCPKCGADKLYEERYRDGTDHYCPICGYRRTFGIHEHVLRTPLPESKKRPRRGAVYVKKCPKCEGYFEGGANAIYCGSTCRQTAYKARKKAKAAGA